MTTPHGNGRAEAWSSECVVGPFRVMRVVETGSTNADLMGAAGNADVRHGTVLVADRQTAGRGRLDRSWESPPTGDGDPAGLNLLMSILFRLAPTSAHEQIQRVALAAVRACERVAGVSPVLKWPNDLLLDGAKLAGILAQAGHDFVVVGIGLNIAWAPDGATRLPAGDRDQVVRALLEEFVGLPLGIADEYRHRLDTLGRRVRVELVDETFEGEAVDITTNGGLVVAVGGVQRIVMAGDVIHLRAMGR